MLLSAATTPAATAHPATAHPAAAPAAAALAAAALVGCVKHIIRITIKCICNLIIFYMRQYRLY